MQNLRAILLMIAAMAGFALSDMLIKWVSTDMPVGQILVCMGLGGGLLFALMTRANGHAVLARDFFHPGMILRNLAEMGGTVCFVTSLSLIDISAASAILQATPLAVTLGAALFLGEQVGWRRWSAIAIGFLGVLIMLRPGFGVFDPQTLWVVLAMLALSLRDLATRMVPDNTPTLRVATYGMSMLLPAGLALLALGDGPRLMAPHTSLLMALAVLIAVAGYYAITSAMRLGDIAVVSPFRYARMGFALVIGILVFDENPDLWTLLGVSITIAAGVYTFLREARRPRPTAAASPLATL